MSLKEYKDIVKDFEAQRQAIVDSIRPLGGAWVLMDQDAVREISGELDLPILVGQEEAVKTDDPSQNLQK